MYQNNYYPFPNQSYYAPNVGIPDALGQYKGQYQPMVQQPLQNDMLWVLNETEATSYPVAPNNSVTLWDKNKDTVYIKSVNGQGIPSMRILDYTERADNTQKRPETHECQCKDKFVPMDTYNALVEQIDVLRAKVESMAITLKKKGKEETENG